MIVTRKERQRRERFLTLALLLGVFLVPINSTMIVVGLSTISTYFQKDLASISWVVAVYLIVMAITQPIAGKLGDIYGNRRLYLWGIWLFFISSIACDFSSNLLWLIVFRAMQAAGGALITPNATALFRHNLSKEQLPRVLSLLSMSTGLGGAIGPLLGSTLISLWDWQAIFWVNIPFLFALILISPLVIPKTDQSTKARLDWWGSFYLAISLTVLVLLTHSQSSLQFSVICIFILSISMAVSSWLGGQLIHQ